MLVEEISHRVLNEYMRAIASINLAAIRTSDRGSRDVLRQAAGDLQAHAEAHRVLQAPRIGESLDLSEYLERVCAAISAASLIASGVRLTLVQQAAQLPAAQCWRIGLLVSELINNAVRHGFQADGGEILVEVSTSGAEVRCQVTDNGRSNANPRFGRGRTLVDCLAADVGGQVEWFFGDAGVSVLLRIPLAAPQVSPASTAR